MSEQQATSACPHPEAVGERWEDLISKERQAELQGYLDRWAAETDHGERKGPFDKGPGAHGVRLTGADVSWLAMQSGYNPAGFLDYLHLEGADLNSLASKGAHLEGAILAGAYLEHAELFGAHLTGVKLAAVNLERATLNGAHLEDADLLAARLDDAHLIDTHLEHADLRNAHLERANLNKAHLTGANIEGAYLKSAELHDAHLEGASLVRANIQGANLSGTWLDTTTVLNDALVDTGTRLGDIHWSGVGSVNLTGINWSPMRRLGDEHGVGWRSKAAEHDRVVRAYRQLAAQLRAQGMAEVADRFAYRAQVWQRRLSLRRFRIPQYLGTLFLDLISGYGYRPMRSLIAYVLVILAFAAAYFALGGANGQALSWNEAVVISMTAFHGRGFFAAVFQPGDLQAAVAAIEAFIGLLIEIVFIATFTQRFFAR
jgi:uncharacterized protein YjbI with pentapeptide repeats